MFTAAPALLVSASGVSPVTWDPANKGTHVVLSSGNLIADVVNFSEQARATVGKSAGKFYVEFLIGTISDSSSGGVGFVDISSSPNAAFDGSGLAYRSNGFLLPSTFTTTWAPGDVVGVTIDYTLPLAVFGVYVNNVFAANKTASSSGIVWTPAVSQNFGNGGTFLYTLRPDAASQSYAPPAGFAPYS